MDVILDFDFKLNKNQVINTLKSYCETITTEEIGTLYDSLLPTLYECVEPVGIFTIENREDNLNFKIVKNCSHIAYCMISMGDKVTEKVNSFFSYARMNEGMVLDAMATSYLFEISSQLFKHVYKEAENLNLGLTCRIAPGDGVIPLSYQENILKILDAENFLDIRMVDDCMLSSLRTMAYIYGADESLPLNKKDHDCNLCPNRDKCSMRKNNF